jgi:hypothetical protein
VQDDLMKGALEAANHDRTRLQDLLKKATAEATARKQSVELLSAEAERAKAALANNQQQGGGSGNATGRGPPPMENGLRSEAQAQIAKLEAELYAHDPLRRKARRDAAKPPPGDWGARACARASWRAGAGVRRWQRGVRVCTSPCACTRRAALAARVCVAVRVHGRARARG